MTACTMWHAKFGMRLLPQLAKTSFSPSRPSRHYCLKAHSMTGGNPYMPAAVQDGDTAPRSIAFNNSIICSPDAASKLRKDPKALLQDFGLDWQHELVDCVVSSCAGVLACTKICSNALQVLHKVVI